MSRRRRLAVALLGVLACGGRAAAAAELRLWAMGREGEVARELVADFERAHPGVRVRVQQIPWSAAHEKLLTAFVGGSMPDVFQVGNTWVPELVALDAMEPADRHVADVRDDFFPGLLDTNVVERTLWAVPWYADTRLLFERTDLLARAGVRGAPRTWAEWTSALERVQRADGGADRSAILVPLREWQLPVVLALQRGAALLRDDGTRGDFTSAAVRDAFAFYVDLFRRGFARRDADTQLTNVYQDFAAGRFVFYVTGPWNLEEFQRRLPPALAGAWDVAPMPAPEADGPGVSLAGGASLAVARTTGHADLAWALVRHLTEPAALCRLQGLAGSLPARRSAWTSCAFAAPADGFRRRLEAQLEHVRATPKVPEWERIATRIAYHLELVVRGDRTLDDALAALDRDADRILAKRRWLRAHEAG